MKLNHLRNLTFGENKPQFHIETHLQSKINDFKNQLMYLVNWIDFSQLVPLLEVW